MSYIYTLLLDLNYTDSDQTPAGHKYLIQCNTTSKLVEKAQAMGNSVDQWVK